MLTERIAYQVGERTFTGYLADDDARPPGRPGVLVCHQAPGLNEHAMERARMLAELGYVAFALDLYGFLPPTVDEARATSAALVRDPPEMERRALAALATLKALPQVDARRIAAVGYCLGGSLVLNMTRMTDEFACVVAFHPGMGLVAADDGRAVSGKILACVGDGDPFASREDRARFESIMQAAGADWQLHVYGGVLHSFTDKSIDVLGYEGFGYDAAADRRSWGAMRDLFDETIGAP